jgi:hypothetical protein
VSPSRKRPELFSLRFGTVELEAIREAATNRGQTIAQFLREAALQAISNPPATGPRCAACGRQTDLTWVVIRGEMQPTIVFAPQPFAVNGPYRWSGWRCRLCCLRDYGFFFALRGAA